MGEGETLGSIEVREIVPLSFFDALSRDLKELLPEAKGFSREI